MDEGPPRPQWSPCPSKKCRGHIHKCLPLCGPEYWVDVHLAHLERPLQSLLKCWRRSVSASIGSGPGAQELVQPQPLQAWTFSPLSPSTQLIERLLLFTMLLVSSLKI